MMNSVTNVFKFFSISFFMKKSKLFIIGIFLLMLIPLVSSVPPIQSSTGTGEGLVLRSPPLDIIKQGTTINSHMHVFNATNDLPVLNDTTECNVHLYNNVGSHILESPMGFDSNGLEWKLEILGGNFSEVGMYSFIVWCNSTTAGGFVSGSLDVTPTGIEFDDAESRSYLIVIIVLALFLAGSLTGFILIPFKNKRGDDGSLVSVNDLKYVKIILGFISYGFFVWLANIMVSLTTNYIYLGVSLGFFTMMFRVLLWMIYPALIITIVILVWNMFNDMKLSDLLNRGFSIK